MHHVSTMQIKIMTFLKLDFDTGLQTRYDRAATYVTTIIFPLLYGFWGFENIQVLVFHRTVEGEWQVVSVREEQVEAEVVHPLSVLQSCIMHQFCFVISCTSRRKVLYSSFIISARNLLKYT